MMPRTTARTKTLNSAQNLRHCVLGVTTSSSEVEKTQIAILLQLQAQKPVTTQIHKAKMKISWMCLWMWTQQKVYHQTLSARPGRGRVGMAMVALAGLKQYKSPSKCNTEKCSSPRFIGAEVWKYEWGRCTEGWGSRYYQTARSAVEMG